MAGPHMNLVGFLPLPAAPCDLTMIASVGFARLKVTIDETIFASSGNYTHCNLILGVDSHKDLL